ncbi:hypothetical protein [Haladaptatus paucihalophilus]|uniref:DUF8139 domain-containing protein n=1 Tax=Haladaptatus paucihalophilus DX253 TaxID=797209 RepID=A0A1M7BZM7_HALPU|nr:hypothetical protein SAMN05444342_4227 [Haladaptatus paucihalophilus DX253]
MHRFSEGDRIRVDIPDETDPDFETAHGRKGKVTKIIADNASDVTGDKRDNRIYRVQFSDGEQMDFRWRDLRPL